jgi:hypothetical protein
MTSGPIMGTSHNFDSRMEDSKGRSPFHLTVSRSCTLLQICIRLKDREMRYQTDLMIGADSDVFRPV